MVNSSNNHGAWQPFNMSLLLRLEIRWLWRLGILLVLMFQLKGYVQVYTSTFVTSSMEHSQTILSALQDNKVVDETSTNEPPPVASSTGVVIDFISIGSVTRPDLQTAQNETFGKRVRHFYAATEADDVEQDCHKRLTSYQVMYILRRCHSKLGSHALLIKLGYNYAYFKMPAFKKNPSGWICAQKRPLNALTNAVRKYYYHNNEKRSKTAAIQQQHSSSSLRFNASLLPDYLILGDDDTWINIDALKSSLPKLYPSREPRAIAGCLVRFKPLAVDYFTLPFGGFGLVLTRSTLVHLLRPIDCTFNNTNHYDPPIESTPPFSKHDDFEALVCWRLQQNLIGERDVYRQGMSLLDMMYQYSVAAPYLQVEQWGSKSFCLHSDWVWGYLINYYHMARHSSHGTSPKLPGNFKTVGSVLHDRMEGYNHSQFLTLPRPNARITSRYLGQCRNSNDYNDDSEKRAINLTLSDGGNQSSPGDVYCDRHAHFCHRISPTHMRHLHELHLQGMSKMAS